MSRGVERRARLKFWGFILRIKTLLCPVWYIARAKLTGLLMLAKPELMLEVERGTSYPPVGLKCVSEKRRREMTALPGGRTRLSPAGLRSTAMPAPVPFQVVREMKNAFNYCLGLLL